MERNGDELWWINECTEKAFRMKVELTTDEWNEACFCVGLYGFCDINSYENTKTIV